MRALDCAKLVIILGAALTSSVFSDPNPANSGTGSASGSSAGNSAAPSPTSGPSSGLQTGNSLGSMYYQPAPDEHGPNDHGESLDAGAPVSGPQRHERVFEVDSLKKLPTTGVDSKFRGSLLDNSIDSIKSLNPKATTSNQPADPRFRTKELILNLEKAGDQPKKSEPKPARVEAETTPSPTPSATASPAAKDSDSSRR